MCRVRAACCLLAAPPISRVPSRELAARPDPDAAAKPLAPLPCSLARLTFPHTTRVAQVLEQIDRTRCERCRHSVRCLWAHVCRTSEAAYEKSQQPAFAKLTADIVPPSTSDSGQSCGRGTIEALMGQSPAFGFVVHTDKKQLQGCLFGDEEPPQGARPLGLTDEAAKVAFVRRLGRHSLAYSPEASREARKRTLAFRRTLLNVVLKEDASAKEWRGVQGIAQDNLAKFHRGRKAYRRAAMQEARPDLRVHAAEWRRFGDQLDVIHSAQRAARHVLREAHRQTQGQQKLSEDTSLQGDWNQLYHCVAQLAGMHPEPWMFQYGGGDQWYKSKKVREQVFFSAAAAEACARYDVPSQRTALLPHVRRSCCFDRMRTQVFCRTFAGCKDVLRR